MANREGDSSVSAGPLPKKSRKALMVALYVLTAFLGGVVGYEARPVIEDLTKPEVVEGSAEEEVERFLNCLEDN